MCFFSTSDHSFCRDDFLVRNTNDSLYAFNVKTEKITNISLTNGEFKDLAGAVSDNYRKFYGILYSKPNTLTSMYFDRLPNATTLTRSESLNLCSKQSGKMYASTSDCTPVSWSFTSGFVTEHETVVLLDHHTAQVIVFDREALIELGKEVEVTLLDMKKIVTDEEAPYDLINRLAIWLLTFDYYD